MPTTIVRKHPQTNGGIDRSCARAEANPSPLMIEGVNRATAYTGIRTLDFDRQTNHEEARNKYTPHVYANLQVGLVIFDCLPEEFDIKMGRQAV